jgi:hypothetical protein
VTLDGAALPLPRGWVARDYTRYEPPPVEGQVPQPDEGWCLTPASTPVKIGGCPIWFRSYAHPSVAHGPLMDVDKRGGSYGDPHQVCVPGGATSSDLQAAETPFGGRMAEYRRWQYNCVTGPPFVAEQYVVPVRPAYIVFSEHVDATVHGVLEDLAKHASLPPSATALRYEDYGYVRSIVPDAGGVHVAIDRIVADLASSDRDHATYSYFVPHAMYAAQAKSLKVGGLALVETDGTRVILIDGLAR